MIEREGKGPKINANVVVGLMRRAYATGGEKKLRAVWEDTIKSGLTYEQAVKIATGQADLTGTTPGPIEYVEKTPGKIEIKAGWNPQANPAKVGPLNREPRVTPKPRR